MKNLLILLFFFFQKITLNKCVDGSKKGILNSSFTLDGKTLKRAPKDCKENFIINQFNIPCEELYIDQKIKEGGYYILTPVNMDYNKNQQNEAALILNNLNLYAKIDDEEKDENFAVDPKDEENYLNFMDPKFLENLCVKFEPDPDALFLKDTFLKIDDDGKQIFRPFHEYYGFISLEKYLNSHEFNFDSVIDKYNKESVPNDHIVFGKFKKVMFIMNYIFEILTHITGTSPDPVEGWCEYKAEDGEEFDLKTKIINRIKDSIKDDNEEENDENNENDKSKNEDEDEERLKKSKRKLTNCQNYFQNNPIFIPDLSVSDFVFNFSEGMFFQEEEDEINPKQYFKHKKIEDLIQYISLSTKTAPDYLLKTKIFNIKYSNDPTFKSLLKKEPNLNLEDHSYFFFLKRFHNLFQEFITRYILDNIIFIECFSKLSLTSKDKNCPVFLREIMNLLETKEKIGLQKFIDLDISYMTTNPVEIVEDLRVFFKKALFYAEANQNNHRDEDGNEIDVSPIYQEAMGNDVAKHGEYMRVVEKSIKMVRDVEDDVESRKSEGKEVEDHAESNNEDDENLILV